jgi:hypothetical protein
VKGARPMTDHHFIDPDGLERWLEDHDALWITPLFLLLFVMFGLAIYETFAHSDIFLLKSSTPFISTEW